MQTPSIRMLPLNALRVFWAVIRKGSFRTAAADLRVSPQAVSQQIKLLEETLGVVLFERRGRVIEPTEAAILLSHFVQAGFDEFAEGVRRVSATGERNRININVSPHFATRFLIPRLEVFRDRLPGADLRLTTMVDLPDFATDDVDVSIQWGFGDWRDLDATLLVRDPKILCCAPALADQIRSPADLAGMRLLHPVKSGRLWSRVFEYFGMALPDAGGDIEFHDAATMRRGTLSGIGVGLVSRVDALDDLRAGRLVAPLGVEALTDMPDRDIPGFYLLLPRAHRRVRAIAAFCDWIVTEDWPALAEDD